MHSRDCAEVTDGEVKDYIWGLRKCWVRRMEKNEKLFDLIAHAYNSKSYNNEVVKDGLLQDAKKIQENNPYSEIILSVYNHLSKLKAEERINIKEIKNLMMFIDEDYKKLSAKELRKFSIGYGAMFIPFIFR